MTMIQKSILTIMLATSVSYLFATEALISLKDAKKQFADQPEKLQAAKDSIRNYYEPVGQAQESVYEQEVRVICQKALEDFKKHTVTEKSAVVFDIDETLLSDYPFFKERSFDWSIEDAYQFRYKKESAVIRPVQEFYTALKALGYKMILLTSRRDLLYQATHENLVKADYVWDELILLPMELFNKHVSHGAWKADIRKALPYNIIGSVGDSLSDFEGDCCGIKVKLPNYLY